MNRKGGSVVFDIRPFPGCLRGRNSRLLDPDESRRRMNELLMRESFDEALVHATYLRKLAFRGCYPSGESKSYYTTLSAVIARLRTLANTTD